MGFLEEVIEYKRSLIKDLKSKKGELKEKVFSIKNSLDPFKFFDKKKVNIIAEVKKSSPSLGLIRFVDVVEQARLYEMGGASAISVLTEDKYFNGSLNDLRAIKENVKVPVLRKDFIIDEVQIYESKIYGADLILLIVKILEYEKLYDFIHISKELGITPLVEVFNMYEAEKALKAGADCIGINNRDLVTLRVDLKVSEGLLPELKKLGVEKIVIESGIEGCEEIRRFYELGANIFLVGTSLMKSDDPVKKLIELKSCV